MDRVLVTRPIPRPGLDMLEAAPGLELVLQPEKRALGTPELIEMAAGSKVVVASPGTLVGREFLAARPEVRMVANYAVGHDNLDLAAARELGVVMTNTPGVLTEATADMALALMLAVTRGVVWGDRFVRRGGFKGIDPTFTVGMDLTGKTLGVYGLGRIGRALGRRAVALGMEVIYHNRGRDLEAELEIGAEKVGFPELLARSDVLSINAPLTPETRGVFDLAAFRSMKRTAYLVNTGRGPIVREADLARALKEGLIAGAGLDVFEEEPQVHPGLLEMENVALAPHLGSATPEVRDRMSVMVAENVLAFLAGKEPPNRLT